MAILPPVIKPNQAGSGFTNLSRYLQANRSNKLGQTVASGVQQAGQQARGAVQQAGQQFQEKAGQERARLGAQEQKAGQIIGAATGETGEEDVKTVQNVLGAEFKGPTGVQNAEEVRARAQEAGSLGRAGGSEAGRFGLLQRYVGQGRPAYSAGQQRLDQMLLGQTGQQQLRQARAGAVGVESETERQIAAAAEQGKELQGQARQVAEATKGKLGEAITGYDQAMANQLANQQAQYQAILDQFKTPGEGAIEVDEALLKNLQDVSGGVLKEGETIYGADLSPYLNINQLYNTKQAAQTKTDLAKAQMLAKLGGQHIAGMDQAKLLSEYTAQPEVAGKLAENPFGVTSIADLNQAIAQQRTSYQSGVNQENAHLKNISEVGSGGLAVSSALAKRMIEDRFLNSDLARQQTLEDQTYDETRLRNKAFDYAKQQAGGDVRVDPGEEMNYGNLYAQIQQNEADRLAHEQKLKDLEKEYKTFRVLKKKPTV